MAHDQIAIALGLEVDELETRFADDLTVGAARARLQVITAIFAAAVAGNTAAARMYLAGRPEPMPRRAEKLGKKAQAQAAALTAAAGSEWEELLHAPKPEGPLQ